MLRAPDQRQNSTDAIEGHPLRAMAPAVAGGTTGSSRLSRVSATHAWWRGAAEPILLRAQ
jgi:hypothetical protein